MRAPGHVNNAYQSQDRTVLAFGPLDSGLPVVQIIDLGCQDFDALRSRYGTLVQSIRMISCKGRNVWKQRKATWSTAALATDSRGRVLFVHVRSPYSTHDLINNLLLLSVDIERAMYLEGGAVAQLYFKSGGREVDVVGSKGSGGVGGNTVARPFPNALGLYRLDR